MQSNLKRHQRAWVDSAEWRKVRHEVIYVVLGALVTAGVWWRLGSSALAIESVVAGLIGGFSVAVIVPAGAYLWHYARASGRIREGRIAALEKQFERVGGTKKMSMPSPFLISLRGLAAQSELLDARTPSIRSDITPKGLKTDLVAWETRVKEAMDERADLVHEFESEPPIDALDVLALHSLRIRLKHRKTMLGLIIKQVEWEEQSVANLSSSDR